MSTQDAGRDDPKTEELLEHDHCQNCFSFTLCPRDGDSCEFVSCAQKCGAVFHSCKEPEHLDHMCPNTEVPCLNSGNGCPITLPRKMTGIHLERCPASVVMCMAEWNRWPMYASERQKHIPFRQKNPYAEIGQLDYDLALRDQRMLANLGKVSRRTRMTLRNNLTRRFPAVPLPRQHSVGDNAGGKHTMDLGDDIEFLGVRPDQKLSKQMQQWQDDLEDRLKGKEKPPQYWEFPELEKGNVHKHCSKCVQSECDKDFDWMCPGDPEEKACPVVKCKWACGVVFHTCKLFEHQIICPKYEATDEFAWMYRGVEGALGAAKREQAKKIKNVLKTKKELKSIDDPFTGPGEPARKSGTKSKSGKYFIPDPPPMPKNLHDPCRLDIRLETVTRLQAKPRVMYTFVCAQEFRRDEFGSHSKNIHSDILGGLNNWLEHRCPLASYGCNYSARKLFPHNLNHTIRFSPAVEGFGIMIVGAHNSEPTTSKSSSSRRPENLLDLPVEILMQILGRLDSFSICNLALTNIYLRDLCCSMLESKGCVTLQWERIRKDEKYAWRVAYKRWFFSSGMDPVTTWAFAPKDGVANHLKNCPYNIKMSHKVITKSPAWEEILKGVKDRAMSK